MAVAAGLCVSPAFAATATAQASASSAAPAEVGELVVVAQKREQSIQSVPVAITAFSGQQRALMGITKVQDLTDFAPGLSWTDINDRIFIRGIGRNSDNLNNTSGVAIYYNGIYYGANAAIELQKDDLFIGNIEIDNGPQNTLHGSNADGGMVQYSSNRPTNSYYAEVRAGISNYSEYMVEGVVSGPINDHLKFRLGANYTQMLGGYFDNLDGAPQGGNLVLGGGGNTHYLEGQLEGHWDNLDVWVEASSGEFAANSRGAGALGVIPSSHILSGGLEPSGFYGLCGLPGVVGSANGAGCTGGPTIVPGSVRTYPITANQFPGNNPGNLNIRNFIQEFNSINDQQDNVQLSANVTYHLPSLDVTYLGGYQQFHYVLEFPTDADAGVTSYQEAGLTPASPSFGTCSAVFGPAACEAPLTIFPTPNYTVFNEYDQSFSHELDFTSTWHSPFQYVAGLYWYHEHYIQPVDAGSEPDQPQMAHPLLLTFAPAPPNPTSAASSDLTEITYDSIAAFAQGSYKFNDQWKVSGAVRYTNN
ncbi:MAG: TonB-dependent receptor domain-containing protein, partial [Caulobacteraceae bacterium]